MNARDEAIVNFFHQGLSYNEILACLLQSFNLYLSLRQLKRILKAHNLRRRQINNHVEISNAVQMELQSDGCNLGYRSMHQKLKINYHLNTSRYSRMLLWLRVSSTNNDPEIIANYYLDYVSDIKGTARQIRADFGTENSNVAGAQRFFRSNAIDADDDSYGAKSFLYGKSTSNQRIEAYWSELRLTTSQYWISFFKDMRDAGELDETDEIYRNCLRFSFMALLQRSLNDAMLLHNTHRIRPYPLQECPSGRPTIIYDIPEAYGSMNYKVDVMENDIEIPRGMTRRPLENGCPAEFCDLANFIMDEAGLQMPEDENEAKQLYNALCSVIRNSGY